MAELVRIEAEPIIILQGTMAEAEFEETDGEEVRLNLSGKSLTQVPLSELPLRHRFSSITHLDLSNNSIGELSLALVQFDNLVDLDLSRNEIKTIPPSFCRLRYLRSFSVKHNRLSSSSFPEHFDSLSSLKSLNLGGNQLESIPDVLTRLPALEDLALGDNHISNISPLVRNFKRLLRLYLGGNRINVLPPEMGQMTSLESLSLCGNQLQSLPEETTQLVNLKSLQLHNNRLETLPRSLLELGNITSLSLRNNPLVVRFVKELTFSIPSLQEICGRVVRNVRIPYQGTLPHHLVSYLDSAKCCDNPECSGVYFESRLQKIKFVDFCGKYRVPFMHYVCSEVCESEVSSSSPATSSSEEEIDHVAQTRMRRVLLG